MDSETCQARLKKEGRVILGVRFKNGGEGKVRVATQNRTREQARKKCFQIVPKGRGKKVKEGQTKQPEISSSGSCSFSLEKQTSESSERGGRQPERAINWASYDSNVGLAASSLTRGGLAFERGGQGVKGNNSKDWSLQRKTSRCHHALKRE